MPPDPFEEEAQCLAGRGEFFCLLACLQDVRLGRAL